MSADSGLATFDDVAKNAFSFFNFEKGLESYSDLCKPELLQKDKSTFYGFWGGCYNSYMDTRPHRGYRHVLEWARSKGEGRSYVAQ